MTARKPDAAWLLPWCASDERAAASIRHGLADRLEVLPAAALPQVAAELVAVYGSGDTVRGAVVAALGPEAATALRSPRHGRAGRPSHPRPVAMVFPGHGSQHPGMATDLYARHLPFAAAMDRFLREYGDAGALRRDWFADDPGVPLDEGIRGQPLLYAIGAALAQMLASWGIRPIAVLGHSIGELVAATTAGVLRESDGPALMAARSATFERVTSGSLLAVGASPQQIARYISNDVHLAVVNGPRQVVLGGLSSPVHAVQRALRADGYVCRAVRIRQPFHTPLALPAADAFEAAMGRIPLGAPTIPIYSSALGGRVPDDVAALPRFWAQQMADPVHFWSALDAMLCDTRPILVEAGPGALLTAQARRHPVVAAGDGAALSMLPPRGAGAAHDLQAVLGVAAQLWSEGHDLRWRAVMPALP